MTAPAVKILNDFENARKDIAAKCRPAFDELLLYSLERRHLDVPAFTDMLLSNPEQDGAPALKNHLQQNVRLFKDPVGDAECNVRSGGRRGQHESKRRYVRLLCVR